MIGVGLVGCGQWGPRLARASEEAGARIATICDIRRERLAAARERHPAARLTERFEDLVSDPAVDAVLVATPAASHATIATAALKAGKDVLVEKPLATSSEDASRLVEQADRGGRVLMVDHTFVYSPAVRAIRELLRAGEIGDLRSFEALRIGVGRVQPDVSVLWDLAVHDLAILDHLIVEPPEAAAASGSAAIDGAPPSVAQLTLFFASGLTAHLHASWLGPVAVRRAILRGTFRTIVCDHLELNDPVRIYRNGTALETDRSPRDRPGARWSLAVQPGDALVTMARCFFDCVVNRQRPLTDGEAGLRVVRLLETASASLRAGGRPAALGTLRVV
jgi:predicted dehydrogenase